MEEAGIDVNKEVDILATRLEGRVVVSVDEVNWEEAGRDLRWAALLKLASGKNIHKKQLVDVLEKVWKLSQPASFYKMERNILLVKFMTEEDQEKVLEGGPWTFEGSAIVMQRWEAGMTEDFTNTMINVSIQVHKLPFELR